MFKFLGFLLILGLFGFLVIGVLLGRVIRFLGPEDRGKSNKKRSGNKSQNSKTSNISQKKFSENEGEYISYEEVKDDE
ncbi:MAG: DUF4834 family protein [Dysgonomonas sp.]|jgi:hypothetical protein|uniref:DUF4834 family protein n=1 Tax=unclassified Dysgonomonas TaxID=2630389 RepID=UPI0025C29BB1|nr:MULTISPECIES: DUF4834 family protein [unclassified Dysgonomonas]MDR1715600.1 DUF4834 family protein [Prevotella sp.]MDR2002201.1 DUF4834 family protein [Prevotella sp.]HMM03388.1 DUF4834 domain-containing protein [Dysgonomonas sp.]